MNQNVLLSLPHRKEAELPFDEYSVVSKKKLINERIRLNDLLFSLNQEENKDEIIVNTINLINENLLLLNRKIKIASRQNRQVAF
ncbi:MAG TPA: hypothetical protein DCR94_02565, partial [Firmicutes bacterium]|nr:hypothetical protein [Bacillota bacterium]